MTAGNSGMYNFFICNSFSKNCSINSEYLFILIIIREHVQYMYIVPYLYISQSACVHYFSLLISASFCVCFYMTSKLVFDCVVFPYFSDVLCSDVQHCPTPEESVLQSDSPGTMCWPPGSSLLSVDGMVR